MITSLSNWKRHKETLNINESQSLTPSWYEALGEYQKLRDIVQNSSDDHLKSEFKNLIEIYFYSNMAVQPEEVYRKIIPEIQELLDHPDTKLTKANESLRSVKVTYANGDVINTSINGTDAEIKDYYAIGKVFNLGKGEEDNMQAVKEVEILESANESRIALASKDDVLDVFPEQGYVILKQKNSNGQREMVIVDDEVIPQLIDILKKQIENVPAKPKNHYQPQYSVDNKISQDLSDLLTLAFEEDYNKFISALVKFEDVYDLVLVQPEEENLAANSEKFDWEDEKDFTDSKEDKQDITARWLKAFSS